MSRKRLRLHNVFGGLAAAVLAGGLTHTLGAQSLPPYGNGAYGSSYVRALNDGTLPTITPCSDFHSGFANQSLSASTGCTVSGHFADWGSYSAGSFTVAGSAMVDPALGITLHGSYDGSPGIVQSLGGAGGDLWRRILVTAGSQPIDHVRISSSYSASATGNWTTSTDNNGVYGDAVLWLNTYLSSGTQLGSALGMVSEWSTKSGITFYDVSWSGGSSMEFDVDVNPHVDVWGYWNGYGDPVTGSDAIDAFFSMATAQAYTANGDLADATIVYNGAGAEPAAAPEPATLALLGSGLLGIGGLVRRRRA